MSTSRKLGHVLILSLVLLPVLNCASQHDANEKYYLVSVNIQLPYWRAAGAGLLQGASQMKVKAAGGIRTFDRLLAVRALGVNRVGASATKVILDECRNRLKQ